MADQFFEKPILNSAYEYPAQHWELDASGQPTNRIMDKRRTMPIHHWKQALNHFAVLFEDRMPKLS